MRNPNRSGTGLHPMGAFIRRIGFLLLFSLAGTAGGQIESEESEFAYGGRLFQEGMFELAGMQYRNFIENYPGSPLAAEAQFMMGECAFQVQDFERAQRLFLSLLVRFPSSPFSDRAQFRMAEAFEKRGRPADAIESYQRVHVYHPDSPRADEALYRSARLALGSALVPRAEELCRLLLERPPSREYRWKASLLLTDILLEKREQDMAMRQLAALVSSESPREIRAGAYFRRGVVYEDWGYWEDAAASYRSCVAMKLGNVREQRALLRLGELGFDLGGEQEGEEAWRAVLDVGNQKYRGIAWFHLGRLYSFWGRFQESAAAFQAVVDNDSAGARYRDAAAYELGRSLDEAGQPVAAARILGTLAADTAVSGDIRKRALLAQADVFVREDAVDEAVAAYRRYLDLYPSDDFVDAVLLRMGRLQMRRSFPSEEGLSSMRRLMLDYPESRLIPEVNYIYGKALFRLGRIHEAAGAFHQLWKHHGGSAWADSAEVYRRLCAYQDTEGPSELEHSLVRIFHGEAETADVLPVLRESMYRFQRYEDAIRWFRSLEESEPGTGPILLLAEAYEGMHAFRGGAAWLDSAAIFYGRAMERDASPDARFRLGRLMEGTDPESSYRTYLSLFDEDPTDDSLLFRAARVAAGLGRNEEAEDLFRRFLATEPQGPAAEEAMWRLGRLLEDEAPAQADSLFRRLIRSHPGSGFRPRAELDRARLARRAGEDSLAAIRFEALMMRFPNSAYADSAVLSLGELYLRRGQYGNAVSLYRGALDTDSLRMMGADAGLFAPATSSRKACLGGLARSMEGSKDWRGARKLYLMYGREYRSEADRGFVYSALARIAEQENRIDRAKDYWKRLMDSSPSDSTAYRVGSLLMRLDAYEEAAGAFEEMVRLSGSEETRAMASARMIVAMLKQGQIPRADVRINVFRQSFESLPSFEEHMAEFALEKGKAYIEDKNFEAALESLEEAARKYRRTKFRPEAELEIGRVYLITNRTEQALEILTEMPEQYADHPVLARVYLNLGDHYFQNQQYDNAVRALRLAMAEERSPDVVPVAMRYLIRVYDSIRMWDAALALTRRYIREYPDAEDLIQKRVQIGTFFMKLNEYGRAVDYFRDLKPEVDPETEAEIQYWIGDCFNNMGLFQQAVFEYLKVEYLSRPTKLPWNTTAIYQAGQAFLKLEKPDQAKKLFQKIVQKEGATSDLGRIARQKIEEIEAGETHGEG